MATSGSINFNQTRNELIQDAFQLIGVYGVGRTVSSEDMNFASNILNKMVKAWQAKGLHLWSKEEGTLFIADNVGEYTLSNASASARATLRSDTVITEIASGALASGSTSVTVDSTTDMATSDIIGIVQDDDVVHWSTISTIPSSTTLTIALATTAAAAENSNVYTFTTRINKPLRILSMRRVTGVDAGSTSTRSEISMVRLSHQDFFNLPNKSTNGTPSHYYYNPDLTDGLLHLWPRPSDPEVYFEFTFERMIEDFDASTNNPDFPSEWLECLTYQLAYRLAPPFGKDKNKLQPEASVMLTDLLNWDAEVTSITIEPDISGRY